MFLKFIDIENPKENLQSFRFSVSEPTIPRVGELVTFDYKDKWKVITVNHAFISYFERAIQVYLKKEPWTD